MGFSIEAKILGNQRGENERRDIYKSADSRKIISKSAYDESLRETEAADWTTITNFFRNQTAENYEWLKAKFITAHTVTGYTGH